MNQIATINLNHNLIAQETTKDENMQHLLRSLETGKSLDHYGYHDGELCLHDGCVMKVWRVMITRSLQKHILEEIHFGHLGMVKTKAKTLEFCYWKGLDKDIEYYILKCRQSREKQNSPKEEINHPWGDHC